MLTNDEWMDNPEKDMTDDLNSSQVISCKSDIEVEVQVSNLKLSKFSNLKFKIFKYPNISLKFYHNVERFFARENLTNYSLFCFKNCTNY